MSKELPVTMATTLESRMMLEASDTMSVFNK